MDFSTMGQPEYRSTITMYVCPLWWKKLAHRLWKGLVGRIGGVGGSDAWEGDITLHVADGLICLLLCPAKRWMHQLLPASLLSLGGQSGGIGGSRLVMLAE